MTQFSVVSRVKRSALRVRRKPGPCRPHWELRSTLNAQRSTDHAERSTVLAHPCRDDRKAAVDIGNLAGHCAGKVGEEERRDVADLVDRHVAAQGRGPLDEAEDL